ncbi:MAG: nitrate reductase cytochrome c-type subunit [Opitutaceae bacterium]
MPHKAKSIKATTLVVAAVFTISVSGFFMGMRQTVKETGQPVDLLTQHDEADHSTHSVKPAVDYSLIAEAGFGPNAHFKSQLNTLVSHPADSGHPIQLLATAAVLREKRNARRAYDGAPPIVPHPITQDSAASCLQCHSKATQIGDVVAPGISHPIYTSCTQCHVSDKGLGSRWNTAEFDLHTGNRFAGNYDAKPVERAYTDSPPTIPHQVHMRQNCMSCHGELGTSPIRTTHPERQSCTQCHVPSGQVDKSNFAESPFPLIEEMLEAKEATTP